MDSETANPAPELWACQECRQENDEAEAACIACEAARPRETRNVLVVETDVASIEAAIKSDDAVALLDLMRRLDVTGCDKPVFEWTREIVRRAHVRAKKGSNAVECSDSAGASWSAGGFTKDTIKVQRGLVLPRTYHGWMETAKDWNEVDRLREDEDNFASVVSMCKDVGASRCLAQLLVLPSNRPSGVRYDEEFTLACSCGRKFCVVCGASQSEESDASPA